MGGLKDGYLYTLTPEDFIAWVAGVTLATISKMTAPELQRIGFIKELNDKTSIWGLYSMTSAGAWVSRVNASGQLTEANSTVIKSETALTADRVSLGAMPTVGCNFDSNIELGNAIPRVAQIPLTEAGGAIVAVLVTGISGYYAICKIKRIWAPAGTTDAANTWTVASEAGGAITGPTVFTMNLTENRMHWIDAGAAGISGEGVLLYNTTDDKNIELSVADLAAVGTTYYIEVEYWYET